MKAFHAIAGLPRAGSTILCDVLNQNPAFYASSTSTLPVTLLTMKNQWSGSAEIKSDLANDKEGTEDRLFRTMTAVANAWYPQELVVFDKSRAWVPAALLLQHLIPTAKVVVCVRDPRDVLASIEKHNNTFPVLDNTPGTLLGRADVLFAPDGLIGAPIIHLEDQLSKGAKNLVPFMFESFVQDPERELKKLYLDLGLDWFEEHNFSNVESTATDLDAMYLNKFPHQTSPEISPPNTNWQDYIPTELGQMIINKYPRYCQTFGYR